MTENKCPGRITDSETEHKQNIFNYKTQTPTRGLTLSAARITAREQEQEILTSRALKVTRKSN